MCDFITTHLQINIGSHRNDETAIVPVITQDHADAIHADPGVVKLFYQESYKYGCHAFNWGASKGMDHFQDACVVLNDKNWKLYLRGSFEGLPAQTRNKLYVACSRARGDIYLVHEKHFRTFKAS